MSAQTTVPPDFRPVDLTTVQEIVADAQTQVMKLDGVTVGSTSREQREVTVPLLHLADDLMLASTLVRNAYWAARGEESYEL
jgi:hypothetical protein